MGNLYDSLPVLGMAVVPSSGFNPSSFPSSFRLSEYYSHINDVELERVHNVTHYLWRGRKRIEALHVGGAIAVGDCILTSTAAYHKARRYTKAGDYWYNTIMSYQIATYPAGSRIIGDIEWIDDRNLIVTIAVNGAIVINRSLFTLPELTSPTLYYRFQNDSWTRVGVLSGTVSNLSICYDKDLDAEYVTKSWQAVSTVFLPYTSPMTTVLSDNVMTSRIMSSYPNSAAHQLDTLLVRGMSHKMFTILTVEPLGDGNTEIALWLNTYDIELKSSDFVNDFVVGDLIYFDGSEQEGLNGCWRVERVSHSAVYFIANGEDYEDEEGFFLIKRAPVGGGAWSRNASREFVSSSSTLDEKLVVNDIDKNSSTFSLKNYPNQTVFLRRFHKRSSSHYLGEDKDSSQVHWTIIGDDLRFVFVVAYKQNPRAHSRIVVFGDVVDVIDDTLKTMLIGYANKQMGDVGFNKMHEYFEAIFSDEGILQLGLRSHQPSGMGWVYSNGIGEVDYLQGTKDCGQHQYPIPYPLT